ncbi:MAG: SH3 domain-containing protein [Anaerolineae bacterium]|jgi:hypothetical protein|nr:SH3 domain-containing protein [Anaerolineae bacterium]
MKIPQFSFLLLLAVLGVVTFTTAQPAVPGGNACTALVEQALIDVGNNCSDLARNSGCYGYNQVSASFVTEVAEDFFDQPADRADLISLQSMQTSPLDLDGQTWGVAVLNVQANVPNTLPGQAVTLLLFGDTEIENAVAPEAALLPVDPISVVVRANQNRVNMRSGPGSNFNVIASIPNGTALAVDGRDETGTWARVSFDDQLGWISTTLIAVSGTTALDTLPIVTDKLNTPMQAFYFTTGIGAIDCVEAPNVLVIQSPENLTVNLTVNGAEFSIESTAGLFSTQDDLGTLKAFEVMSEQIADLDLTDETACRHTRMFMLDGAANLNEGEMRLPLGHLSQQITCQDADGAPVFVSEWDTPQRMSENDLALYTSLELVPEDLLHYPIRIPSNADIDAALATPTPRPRPTLPAATRVPGTSAPRATPVPGVNPTNTPQTGGTVNCGGFQPTSPLGGAGVNFGPQDFYWDPVNDPNISAYQVDVRAADGSGGFLVRIGANSTTVNINLRDRRLGLGTDVIWFVQALTGNNEAGFSTVCQTGSVTVSRQMPPPDLACRDLGGRWDGSTCSYQN